MRSGAGARRVRSTEGEDSSERLLQSEACDAKRGRLQEGCEALRTRTALKGLPQSEACDAAGGPQEGGEGRGRGQPWKGLPQSEACDAKAGRFAKRVRSTEDEDSPERLLAVRAPATQSGQVAKKGAKHRGRDSPGKWLLQSEACDAKRGRLQKGCEALRTRTVLERATAVRSLRRKAGQAAKKGAKHRGRGQP